MSNADKLENLIASQKGIVFSRDLDKANIPRLYLSKYVNESKLERVSRGIYISKDLIEDRMYYMQLKYPKIIYSHETALFLHGLSDRTPFEYSFTVPSGYRVMKSVVDNKIYYIKPENHLLGVTTAITSFGNTIKTYNIERTICDIIRSRNKIDVQIFADALKRFVKRRPVDYTMLGEYAKKLRVDKILNNYLEVMLWAIVPWV